MSNTRADLVARIAKAATFSEQAALVTELDAHDQGLRAQAADERDLEWADTVVTQTLVPVRTFEFHTAATDWIADFEPEVDTNAHHASIAEAALWFGRCSPEVKADVEEFGIQAEGFMRREASKHGEQANDIYQEGLAYLGFLYRRHGASGLDQIQQTVNPHEDNAPTPLPPDVFDNFAPDVDPINAGVVGTEDSSRAPLLQEIEQEGNGSAQPENPGGHSTTDDVSYPDQPADASSGPMDMEAIGGEGSAEPEEPDEHNEEGAPLGAQGSWDARSVAIDHTMTMDDFRASQARTAASGLDQIQQTVNPHEDPSPTPLPVKVMFPWMISPNQSNEGNEDEDVPPSGAADVANSPNPYQGGRKQAGYGIHATDVLGYGHEGEPLCTHCHGPEDESCEGVCGPIFGSDEDGPMGTQCSRCGDDIQKPWPTASRKDYKDHYGDDRWYDKKRHQGSRKTADMYGNSDMPHQVPGPSPSNTPATGPVPNAGYSQGYADAQRGDHPTYADASTAAPSNVQQYTKGYSDGVNAQSQGQGGNYPPQDKPGSMGGDNGQNVTNGDLNSDVSDLAAAASKTGGQLTYHESYGEVSRAQLAAYRKHNVSPSDHDYLTDHYGEDNHDAITKAVKDPANQQGRSFSTYKHQDNLDNRGGGYASSGGTGWGRISSRFVKEAARTDPDFRKGYGFGSKWQPGKPLVTLGSAEFEAGVFAALIDRPSQQEAWVAAHRRQARKDQRFATRMQTYSRYMDHLDEMGISLTAATSTDLDTLDPSASPSQSGQTPINGRGQPGPLDGQQDAAAAGGPSPYNGAPPLGHPVVPTGSPSGGAGSNYVNDIPGGPADGNVNPATLAFRRQVQASLLQHNKRG
jgi:hypothetical protein